MELIFDNQKELKLEMDSGANIRKLIALLKENYLRERPEMFVQGDTVYVIYALNLEYLSLQSAGDPRASQ